MCMHAYIECGRASVYACIWGVAGPRYMHAYGVWKGPYGRMHDHVQAIRTVCFMGVPELNYEVRYIIIKYKATHSDFCETMK